MTISISKDLYDAVNFVSSCYEAVDNEYDANTKAEKTESSEM